MASGQTKGDHDSLPTAVPTEANKNVEVEASKTIEDAEVEAPTLAKDVEVEESGAATEVKVEVSKVGKDVEAEVAKTAEDAGVETSKATKDIKAEVSKATSDTEAEAPEAAEDIEVETLEVATDAEVEVEVPGTDDVVEAETPKITHDSMVTVRLSEPPALALDTSFAGEDEPTTPTKTEAAGKRPASVGSRSPVESVRSARLSSTCDAPLSSLQEELEEDTDNESSRTLSGEQEEVDWEKLEKTEDEQTKGDDTDNSTALLLARLEQENAKLATNPKSVKVKVEHESTPKKTRPPSMAQLRQMVTGPTSPALRYSMLPPPPMTDLEFWAALVKDYQQTAARLPTLLSKKIHKGIPPPLRGVVWQSMSGARDFALEEQYVRLSGESSPYEPLIGKDLNRSFPGVEMFRDPDGDGQQMLGKVLKAFSLYDTKIGYCQGLAFLVGPLLMHMPDKQAFCVLVRLMERYDLRTCFLPDLSGLHVRIYQFRELLRSNLPELSSHFEELQIDPAYVSQWFLSFFAVTCPLPMLFRIYDVIFAEGASETLMRVALSLMRKNEARLLACSELEDAMQLLLSRGIWDCYHYDADSFVDDFVSLTGEVSREKLSRLEQGYRESLVAAASVTRASDITTAATRFLGRIWASSSIGSPRSATLSPSTGVQPRPLSLLRRSTSKQSLASTLNSMEASSSSVTSSTSTVASTVSRDSSNTDDVPASRESTPVGPKPLASPVATDERYLHSQIEDLLTALSELQRNHAVLTNQLQKEREARDEERRATRSLLHELKELPGFNPTKDTGAESASVGPSESLTTLLEQMEERFKESNDKKHESLLQSKAELLEQLSQAKQQSSHAEAQTQEQGRRIQDLTQELSATKDLLRESHAHVRTLHQDKQRLEKQVHGLKTRSAVSASGETVSREQDAEWARKGMGGGLREFKLSRSKSIPTPSIKRASSLPLEQATGLGISVPPPQVVEPSVPSPEKEALLIELAQAKTAEAIAKQEAEEAKQRLEAFRKAQSAHNLAAVDANAQQASMGVFGRLAGHSSAPSNEAVPKQAAPKQAAAANTNSGSGGFWGWRR
ncbi:unnamed protein product [Clonostachys byssicola]|uniref:Rab-GAP TBC domain-containing protein n=1 Tax=Clonostachys byssicola TaxID=160290 RepID=A0A9N9UPP6_9HYPO|nr:unnamed protein product [Clonostachys byssicola]